MKLRVIHGLLTGALLLTAPYALGQIFANFSEGNGTDVVDGFVGKAGNGWTGGWEQAIHDSTISTLSATVSTADPLPGNSHYLSVRRTLAKEGGNGSLAQRRRYSDYGNFQKSQSHVVRFDFRLDDASGFSGSIFDRIYFFDATGGRNFPGTNLTWEISYDDSNKVWSFMDGNLSGGGNTIRSTLGLSVGTVYSFQVEVDPSAQIWDVMISDGSETVRASDFNQGNWLQFKNDYTEAGGNFHFGSRLQGLEEVAEQDFEISYSIGNISIVPEPGTTALGIGWAGLMLTWMWRRHSRW